MKDDRDKLPDTVRVMRAAPPRPAQRPPPVPTPPAFDPRARAEAAEARRQVSQHEIEVREAFDAEKRHVEVLERELAELRQGVAVVARAIGTDAELPEGLRRSLPPPSPNARRLAPSLDARARATVITNYVQLAILVLYFLLAVLAEWGLVPPPSPLPQQNAPLNQR